MPGDSSSRDGTLGTDTRSTAEYGVQRHIENMVQHEQHSQRGQYDNNYLSQSTPSFSIQFVAQNTGNMGTEACIALASIHTVAT